MRHQNPVMSDRKREDGVCCLCGYRDGKVTPCPDTRGDGIHCVHWWDGSDGDTDPATAPLEWNQARPTQPGIYFRKHPLISAIVRQDVWQAGEELRICVSAGTLPVSETEPTWWWFGPIPVPDKLHGHRDPRQA